VTHGEELRSKDIRIGVVVLEVEVDEELVGLFLWEVNW